VTNAIETFEPCTTPGVPPDARLERIERRQLLLVRIVHLLCARFSQEWALKRIRDEWGDEL